MDKTAVENLAFWIFLVGHLFFFAWVAALAFRK
jgi:hypothetical protein